MAGNGDCCIDAKVEVAIRGVLIMADRHTIEAREELGEVLGVGWADIGLLNLAPVRLHGWYGTLLIVAAVVLHLNII